jgi:hypothetical protein
VAFEQHRSKPVCPAHFRDKSPALWLSLIRAGPFHNDILRPEHRATFDGTTNTRGDGWHGLIGSVVKHQLRKDFEPIHDRIAGATVYELDHNLAGRPRINAIGLHVSF